MLKRATSAAISAVAAAAVLVGSASTALLASAAPINESDTGASSSGVCPDHPFAFECDTESCCASYHQRFLFLLFALAVFGVALVVLGVWMAIEMRPSKRQLRQELKCITQQDKRRPSEIDIKSDEEAKYLRRMSELNPNAKRLCVE